MKCVSVLSTVRNTETAMQEVVRRASEALGEGEPADLALVFASMHHADALGAIGTALTRGGLGRHVLGCTGESIIGEDQEVEGTAALSVWSLRLPGLKVRPRHLTFAEGSFGGWPELEREAEAVPAARRAARADSTGPALIVLGDPFSFPSDLLLKRLGEVAPGMPVVGGMASGSQTPGENRLLLDGSVSTEGAVTVELDGPLAIRTVVSQGCRPIGRTAIVTKIERNVIRELGRRPTLEVLRAMFEDLPEEDRQRVQQGLHIGRVINEYQETFQRGDFLVRNVLGADEAGGLAITDVVRVGQTVQFHVRDAGTADEDLRGLLSSARNARPDARIAGALLFSCNGRGTRLFPEPDHDVSTLREVLGAIPVAGFFAMGEIGPIGGQNFLHGFTASIALFEEVDSVSSGA
jgi:small ligand-binding sensory domain FIST